MSAAVAKPSGRRIGHLSLAIALAALVLGGIVAMARSSARHAVADLLGVQVKNEILSWYTLAVAPPVNTDDLVPIAHDSEPPYAVNVFLDQEVQASNVERTLDLVKAAGFRFIKQELLWSNVERPRKGEYQDRQVPGKSSWANYDRIVSLAQQKGLQVIFRIDTSPAWARPAGAATLRSPEKTPPVSYEDYGDFVAAVVRRYKGRVHYYQIWNEPNLASEWGGQAPNPAEYTRLLRIAYTRAKQVDPSVVILSAALAPTIQNDRTAMPDTEFLQQMYDDGAKPYFDVLSANAYGLRDGPDDWRFQQSNDVNFSRPVLLREIMVRNGDAGKPIWASEIGWNSLPANWSQLHPGQTPLWGSVSRDLQAAYTVRAYQRAAEQWPWMGVMAVWHFRMVYPENEQSQQYYFDMVGLNWHREPIYFALQRLMTSAPVVYRGYHQEDYWALHWSKGWQRIADPRASLGHLEETAVPGAELDFNLNASWLDLVTPTGPGWGKLSVTIDGLPYAANRLPIVNGQATLDLHAATERWQVRQPIADGLGPGVHHVQIRVLSGRVGIDGLVADSPSPQTALYLTVGLVALGGLVFGITLKRHPTGAILVPEPATTLHQSPDAAPRLPSEASASVSVIATVRNEEQTIAALLASLERQTLAPTEIVIADGGSTDRTPAIILDWLERGLPITLLRCPGANIAAGRNQAIRAARGEIIACTDAGVRLDPHWLESIVAPLRQGADVSMGFFRSDPSNQFELALGATTLPDADEIRPERFIPSSRSIAYWRRVWEAVGGYPEWLDYCEDVVFDLKLRQAGLRFAWVPEAVVHFRPRASLRAFFRQYYLYARGDGKANLWPRRHAIRYATYLLAPLVFLAGFWYNPAWLALGLGTGVYLNRPYRRLLRAWLAKPAGVGAFLELVPLVALLRVVGDVAKMAGYPAGVWWRIKREVKGA